MHYMIDCDTLLFTERAHEWLPAAKWCNQRVSSINIFKCMLTFGYTHCGERGDMYSGTLAYISDANGDDGIPPHIEGMDVMHYLDTIMEDGQRIIQERTGSHMNDLILVGSFGDHICMVTVGG